MNIHIIVVLNLIVFVSACSNSLQYTSSINKFAEASKQAEAAMRVLSAQTQSKRENLVSWVLENPGKIVPNGCSFNDENCELNVTNEQNNTEPLASDSKERNSLSLMSNITAYANDLMAIAVANREEEISAALFSVTDSLGSVANINDLSKSPTVSVGNQVVAFFVNQNLNSTKLTALKEATTAAEQVMDETEEFLNEIQLLLVRKNLNLAKKEYDRAQTNFLESESRPIPQNLLEEYDRAAEKMNILLQTKLNLSDSSKDSSLYSNVREAHRQLYTALHAESPQTLDTALLQIDHFASEAKRFADIIRKLKLE